MGNSSESFPPVAETDEAEFRLYAFHMLGKVFDHALDLDTLLVSALDMFIELTRADAGFIMLMDEKADALVFGAAKGLKKGVVERIKANEVNIKKDVAREITQKKLPILLASVGESRLDSFFRELLEPVREVAITECFPLVSSRKLVGLINITESTSGTVFKKTDPHRLFSTICNQVAVAVENSQLHQHLVEQFEEIRRTNEELRESEQRIHLILDNAVDAIISMNERCIIESFNPAAETVFGYSEEEVLGKNINMLMPQPYHDEHDGYIASYLRTGEAKIIGIGREVKGLRKDGTIFPMDLGVGELHLGGKSVFIGSLRDITERKLAEAQVIQAAKLATLGEMATSVAHELNQPLNVIRMAAGNVMRKLKKGTADPAYLNDKLDRIASQTERATAIIDHMRMFGRKADEKPAELDLNKTIRNALDLMGEQLRLAEIDVSLDLPEDCPPVMGHPVQVEQVILNLLTNARDAVMANGNEKKITLAVAGNDDGDDRVRITVSDTGGGIPEECLSQIFEPFFTTKKMGEGTGLGLSVSYGIIHDMGGTIEAENTGGGARFTITLPVAGTDAEKGRSDAI